VAATEARVTMVNASADFMPFPLGL